MSNPKKLAIMLVLLVATAAFAQTPGLITLMLNDSLNDLPLHKVNFPANNTGWGVKFNPFSADAASRYVEITNVDVRLCPPPIGDYPYEIQVYIYAAKNGKPDLTNLLWCSDPVPVLVGSWWHHVPVVPSSTFPTVGPLWIKAPMQVVAFAKCVQGHEYMYQYFDATDNAPAGTQWFFDGTVAKRDKTVGDIMINLTYKKHDWAATGITQPTTRTFTPECRIQNITGFNEPVDVRYWITKGSNIVYDNTVTVNAGGLGFYTINSFATTTLPAGHQFKAHAQVMYKPPSPNVYPFGERYTGNDKWTLQFEIYPFGTTPLPRTKND